MVIFRGVFPIGNTDTDALPVKDLGAAIGYYTQVLGFSVISRSEERADLARGDAKIGLACSTADPDDASCYFEVSDVDSLRAEFEGKGIDPSPIRVDENEDGRYRLFFAKEPYGVCFCFGQPQE